jgi:hypothetical protein
VHSLEDYDPEPLVEAVTALDWSPDHPAQAMRALQATVQKNLGEELSDAEAMKLLGSLLDRRFIQTQMHPGALHLVGRQAMRRPAKYVRVPLI